VEKEKRDKPTLGTEEVAIVEITTTAQIQDSWEVLTPAIIITTTLTTVVVVLAVTTTLTTAVVVLAVTVGRAAIASVHN